MVNPTTPPVPTTIAGLPAGATPLGGAEFVPVSQNGVTVRIAANQFNVVGPTGPAGAAGPTGPTGPAGPPGSGSIAAGSTGQIGYYASNGSGLSPATIGSGLSLSAGTLTATATGTVTSVAFTGDGTVLSATPSAAVTTSGTVAASLKTQIANTILAGPTSAGPSAPTFRGLVSSDIPVATAVALGAVQPDGTIITVTAGAITVPQSTSSVFGVVKVDGTTITAAGGVISAASGLPAAVVGALSGASTVFTVDYTTYSEYNVTLENFSSSGSATTVIVDVSTDSGSTWKTATRQGVRISASNVVNGGVTTGEVPSNSVGVAGTLIGRLSQPSTSAAAALAYTSQGTAFAIFNQFGCTTFNSSAAINRIRFSVDGGATFSAGNAILQPISHR